MHARQSVVRHSITRVCGKVFVEAIDQPVHRNLTRFQETRRHGTTEREAARDRHTPKQSLGSSHLHTATPKTQSALLEAMQEKSVTVGGVRHALNAPFLVLATQNPIEQEGTYPLPEAQLDRFTFKLEVGYGTLDELMTILDRTTGAKTPEVSAQIDGPGILEMQSLVRNVIVAPHVKQFAARLAMATHPGGEFATKAVNQYIRCGSSPRGAQALLLASKVHALRDGRFHVAYSDIKAIALPALRHRVILNFEAEADRVSHDALVKDILERTPTEPVGVAV